MYRIRNWKENFEVSQSLRATSKISWVAIPNSHDGRVYKRLMRLNPLFYLVYILLVQVASRVTPRGLIADKDGPLTVEDLEVVTECPAQVFREAIPVLCSPEIGLLEEVPLSESTPPAGVRMLPLSECSPPTDVTDVRTSPAQTAAREALNGTVASTSSPTPATEPGHGGDQRAGPAPEPYNGSTVWRAWTDLHRARGLVDPVRVGADLKAAKELAGLVQRERLTEILTTYLDDDDSFLEKRGHGLRDLSGRLNSYLNGSSAGGEIEEQAINRLFPEKRTKRHAVEENFDEI